MDSVKSKPNFAGTVTEVNEKSILVSVNEDEDEIKSSDLISVSLNVELKDTLTDFKAGDEVRVYYDGTIAESYPAQIHKVYAIMLVNRPSDNGSSKTGEGDADKTEPSGEDIDPIKEKISKMTVDEKIGQMVMAGIDGYTLDSNSKNLIEKYKVGGFIILGQNVQNTSQLLKLINSLKEANSKNEIPLFMAVDQEGGRVDRMPKEFKRYPSNKEIGKVNDENFSYEVGTVLADEIKSFGFNMDFAPVLDINSNPKNPVIGDRSFGSDAEIVTKLGIKTMKGIQSKGVISGVKHFPGHGDTSVDSHVGLPIIYNDLNRLKDFELIPFSKAIENGADVVMIAHILLPKIDEENPASFSKTIITDILRNDMMFSGVVITDDMTMGAIAENYDLGASAVKSVNAGSDIVMVCHEYSNAVKVIDALKDAVDKGEIREERINESVYRILKLKQKYNLSDSTVNEVNVNDINSKINKVLKAYNS